LRGGVGVAWRYASAQRVAPPARAAWCRSWAFALGIDGAVAVAVVRGDLLADWPGSLPNDAPNNFLVNIRPDQRQDLQDFFDCARLRRAANVSWCAHGSPPSIPIA